MDFTPTPTTPPVGAPVDTTTVVPPGGPPGVDLPTILANITKMAGIARQQGQPAFTPQDIDQYVSSVSGGKYGAKDLGAQNVAAITNQPSTSPTAAGALGGASVTAAPPTTPGPDLPTILQHVVQMGAIAQKQGQQPFTSDDIDQYIQSASGGKYSLKDVGAANLGNIMTSFGQGALMGSLPALVSGKPNPTDVASTLAEGEAIHPGLGEILASGKQLVGNISAALGGNATKGDVMRLQQAAYAREHPLLNLATEGAGGVTGGLLTGGLDAPETLGAVARTGAEQGALFGVGSGFFGSSGDNSDLDSQIKSGAESAAVGAGTGAVLAPVVAGVKALVSPASNDYALWSSAIKSAKGGLQGLLDRAQGFAAAGKGNIVELQDLDPSIRAIADKAAASNPAVATTLLEDAKARQMGTPGDRSNSMAGRTQADLMAGIPDLARGPTPHGTPEQLQAGIQDLQDQIGHLQLIKDWKDQTPEDAAATDAQIAGLQDQMKQLQGFLPFSQTAAAPAGSAPFADGAVKRLVQAREQWAGPEYDRLEAANGVLPGTQGPVPDEVLERMATLKAMLPKEGAAPPTATNLAMGGIAAPRVNPLQEEYNGLVNQWMPNQTPAQKLFLQRIQNPMALPTMKMLAAARGMNGAPTVGSMNDLAGGLSIRDAISLKNRLWQMIPNLPPGASDAVKGFADDIDTRLANTPGVPEAQREYAHQSGIINAVENGGGLKNMSQPQIQDVVSKARPKELEGLRYGIASDLYNTLGHQGGGVNSALTMGPEGSPVSDDVLKTLFKTPEQFDTFMLQQHAENEMNKTLRTPTGSAAAANAAQTPAAKVAGGFKSLFTTSLPYLRATVFRNVAANTQRGINSRTAARALPILQTKGTPSIDAMLQKLAAPQPMAGRVVGGALPAAAGVVGNQMIQGGGQ